MGHFAGAQQCYESSILLNAGCASFEELQKLADKVGFLPDLRTLRAVVAHTFKCFLVVTVFL